MTKQEVLNELIEQLNYIAATVQYQTADRELALTILDCAEKLAGIAKTS